MAETKAGRVVIEFVWPELRELQYLTSDIVNHPVVSVGDIMEIAIHEPHKRYKEWERTIRVLVERLAECGFGKLPITIKAKGNRPANYDGTWVEGAKVTAYDPDLGTGKEDGNG